MGAQLDLPAALAARGLVVEVVPGWETRSAGSFNPKGAVCHWTAGPAGTTRRPSLSICTNGRADLPGPLCNVYLDRNGVAVVVAAGRANHAGAGSWGGATGNSSFYGTECEAAGPDDFTPAQRAAYPRVNAAFCDLGDFGPDMVCGHSEYATPRGRKSDINGYTMADMRADVASVLAGQHPTSPLQEDDMTPDQAKQLAEIHWMLEQVKPNADRIPTVQAAVDQANWGVNDSQQGVRVQLAGLFARVAQGSGTGITAADIAAMVPADFAAAVADELHKRLAS